MGLGFATTGLRTGTLVLSVCNCRPVDTSVVYVGCFVATRAALLPVLVFIVLPSVVAVRLPYFNVAVASAGAGTLVVRSILRVCPA